MLFKRKVDLVIVKDRFFSFHEGNIELQYALVIKF